MAQNFLFGSSVVMPIPDLPNTELLILIGTIIIALGKIAENIEGLYGEMKFFRRHYIQKDTEMARVLKERDSKRK